MHNNEKLIFKHGIIILSQSKVSTAIIDDISIHNSNCYIRSINRDMEGKGSISSLQDQGCG